MPSLRWSLFLGLAFVLATSASPIPQESLLEQEELAAQAELTPEIFGVVEDGDRSDRDKRKVLELKVAGGLGVKQFLIDLLFGARRRTTTKRPPARPVPRVNTTDDVVEFPRTRVSLQVPDELFGGSFTLVTNVSKIVGSVIQNTAERTQRLVEAAKPLFGAKLGISTSISKGRPQRQLAEINNHL